MKISAVSPGLGSFTSLAQQQRRLGSALTSQSLSTRAEQSADIAKLRARDREVRAHEQAHLAAAGGLATGGPTFTFVRGPDGKQYAVGGEVNIDTSPVQGDPEATIQKARQIRAAALAPADPSPQDRGVSAQATAIEARARKELQQDKSEATQHPSATPSSPSPPHIDLFV